MLKMNWFPNKLGQTLTLLVVLSIILVIQTESWKMRGLLITIPGTLFRTNCFDYNVLMVFECIATASSLHRCEKSMCVTTLWYKSYLNQTPLSNLNQNRTLQILSSTRFCGFRYLPRKRALENCRVQSTGIERKQSRLFCFLFLALLNFVFGTMCFVIYFNQHNFVYDY